MSWRSSVARVGAVSALVVALLARPTPGLAQGASPAAAGTASAAPAAPGAPAAAPAATPLDVVRRRDGGMLRGTITELVPNGDVVLMLPSGEVRRLPMSEVRYAGPAAGDPAVAPAPASAPPPAAARTGEVAVAFEADRRDVALYVRNGEARVQAPGLTFSGQLTAATYQRLCSAPCETTLPKGSHRLALTAGGSSATEADESVQLDGPLRLRGVYKSHRGARSAGLAFAIVGAAGGLSLATAGLTSSPARSDFAIAGGGILGVSVLFGALLLSKRDEARFVVLPYAPPAAAPAVSGPPPRSSTAPALAPPGGLAIAGRF